MSTEPAKIFERRFRNQLDDLSRVTAEGVQFLEANGIGGQAVYVANLAIEEMGTNILKYGFDDTAAHEILLRMEIESGAVLLMLEDDGHEFNPLLVPEPDAKLPAQERPTGGLGIHLVRKLAQEMTYQRLNGRNRMTIRIR